MTRTTSVYEGNVWEHESGAQVTAMEATVVRPDSRRAPKVTVWYDDADEPEEQSASLFHKNVLSNKAWSQVN